MGAQIAPGTALRIQSDAFCVQVWLGVQQDQPNLYRHADCRARNVPILRTTLVGNDRENPTPNQPSRHRRISRFCASTPSMTRGRYEVSTLNQPSG